MTPSKKPSLAPLRSKSPVVKPRLRQMTLADRLTGLRRAGQFRKAPSRKTYGAGCD